MDVGKTMGKAMVFEMFLLIHGIICGVCSKYFQILFFGLVLSCDFFHVGLVLWLCCRLENKLLHTA